MGGSKGDKQKKVGDSDPPGALFPRLHVKETRNNGPRAPPRNKMALYEQLTVPSHRFQQSEQHIPPVMSHQQPFIPQAFTGPYYMPYYMTSSMGFQPVSMLPASHNQPNVEANVEGELQEVPGVHAGNNMNRNPRAPPLQSKRSNPVEKVSRQDKEDLSVTTYSSKAKTGAQQTGRVSVGNSTGNSKGTCTQVQAHAGGGSTSRRKSSVEQSSRSASKKSVHTPSVSEQTRRSASKKSVHAPSVSQGLLYESVSNIESNEENGGIDNQSDEDPGRESSQEEAQEGAEDSEDSETSVLENITLPSMNSKDLMHAVGDVTFWKMRKAIQRQQNIFQKQLFELHRVTKVQQLMASAGLCDKEEEEQPSDNVEATSPDTTEAGELQKPVIDEEETLPLQATNQATSAAASGTPSNDHRCYPPLPPPANMGYYPGFPGGNQWFTPMSTPFPYQQPTPAVGILSTPYGPVFGGPFPPMPFVQYSCEQRPPDSRYDMLQRVPSWQQPPHYFAMQWPAYANSGPVQPPTESFRENAAASSSQSRKENDGLQSQAGSSSAGLGQVRGSTTEAGEATEHQQYQQQMKLVGKYTEANQSNSAGNQRHGVSPYSRPSGFQTFSSETNAERASRVTPKASLVTPESAAEILQSIRQDRIDM